MGNDFIFKKSFGQNFLKEDSIVKKIIRVSKINDNSLIIEVGPGSGMLTKELLATNNQVLCYEIDERLEEELTFKFKEYSNFNLIIDDFLNRDLGFDISKFKYDKLYLIANLPYYITTPIINKVIDNLNIDKMVIMVQKEVGDRLSAKPGSKDYNSLTVFLNYYFNINKEFVVSRNCFVPKPNVDSVIVSLSKKQEQIPLKNKDVFNKLLKDSFQFKRKNLRNNLKKYNLNIIESILLKNGFDLTSRAESLPLEIFVEISNSL